MLVFEKISGYLTPETIEKFLNLLDTNFAEHSCTNKTFFNFIRIFNAQFDKTSFVLESIKYEHHLEIITSVCEYSNYLSDVLVQHPEFVHYIFRFDQLERKIDRKTLYSELNEEIQKFSSFESKLNLLKSFKKRYLLKIGILDIWAKKNIEDTTLNLSILADNLLKVLFQTCYKEVCEKYKIEKVPERYTLCSLGKLGGQELNYSSDVDLILLYDKNSKIKNTEFEYFDLLNETAKLFIESGTKITSRGYLYRIDFRLRPDGKHSPICRTINDMRQYYDTRGEAWEKQMLIKIGYVAGSEKLFNDFKNFTHKYIYSSIKKDDPRKLIAKMKKNIELNSDIENNVKLFSGGIRDIEFLVQGLQLLYGSKNQNLHTGNSMNAINVLNELRKLKDSESKLLTETYQFYRRTEHFIQLMDDNQSHSIPNNFQLKAKLAKYFDFKSYNDYHIYLDGRRNKIRKLFNSFTGKKNNIIENEFFYNLGSKCQKDIQYLETGVGPFGNKNFDARTIEIFKKIKPVLLDYLTNNSACEKITSNFAKIIRSTSFPSMFYRELQNNKFFKLFLKLCTFNQNFIDAVPTNPMLLELFLTRKIFIKNYSDLMQSLSVENFIHLLKCQFVFKLINTNKFSELIQKLIFLKIKESAIETEDFFIGALGSLGINDLSLTSDADILIISNNNNEDFLKKLSNLIETIKIELFPIEIDLRLRPEGNKGPVIWDIDRLSIYFEKRARVWEYQSLNKLKFICGSKKLYNRTKKIICKNFAKLNSDEVKNELRKMYKDKLQSGFNFAKGINLKKDKGTLIDIEFILAERILSNPEIYKNSFGCNIKQRFKKLDTKISENISETHFNIKKAEYSNHLIFNRNNSTIDFNNLDVGIIENFLQIDSLKSQIDISLKTNSKILEAVLK